MTQASEILGQILVKIRESRARGRQPLVVFDLDSTLFDVSPRTQAILQKFIDEKPHQSRFPESIRELRNVQIQPQDWGLRTALTRHGLHTHPIDFHQAVRDFWIERFFHGDYLHHDRPISGAVAFTQQVWKTGCRMVYLTGRDLGTMLEASRMVLATHGFPEAELVLKPLKGSDDAHFKAQWFVEQGLDQYDPIYFFENEPVNIDAIEEARLPVQIVFVESTHSGKGQVRGHWPRIRDFSGVRA